MNYIYLNKNVIIYLLIFIFTVIILLQIYYFKPTIREGKKCCKIPKPKPPKLPSPSKIVNDVKKGAEDIGGEIGEAGEDFAKAAEEAAKKLAEELNFANALKELIEPLLKLVNTTTNTLKSLKDF